MSICEFIISLYPSTPEKIQAWAAVLTLVATIVMTIIAGKALHSWKDQKRYDIYIESLSKYHKHYHTLISHFTELQNLLDTVVSPEEYLRKGRLLALEYHKKLLSVQFQETFAKLKKIHEPKSEYNDIYNLYVTYNTQAGRILFKDLEVKDKISKALTNKIVETHQVKSLLDELTQVCREATEEIGYRTLEYQLLDLPEEIRLEYLTYYKENIHKLS